MQLESCSPIVQNAAQTMDVGVRQLLEGRDAVLVQQISCFVTNPFDDRQIIGCNRIGLLRRNRYGCRHVFKLDNFGLELLILSPCGDERRVRLL